jgi:hypothetical protein
MLGEYATWTDLNRRTFWAYAYTSYNESVVSFGQRRTLIADSRPARARLLGATISANVPGVASTLAAI